MMTKYFENSKGDLLVDPIEKNHSGLVELSEQEFKEKLEIKNNTKTDDQQVAEIDAKLLSIDVKKVRPMSAILAASDSDDTSEDLAYLSELESQAVELRAKRAELVGE